MSPNELRIALFEFIDNVDETPQNRAVWREAAYLLLEGDFLPDLHKRMADTWDKVLILSRCH